MSSACDDVGIHPLFQIDRPDQPTIADSDRTKPAARNFTVDCRSRNRNGSGRIFHAQRQALRGLGAIKHTASPREGFRRSLDRPNSNDRIISSWTGACNPLGSYNPRALPAQNSALSNAIKDLRGRWRDVGAVAQGMGTRKQRHPVRMALPVSADRDQQGQLEAEPLSELQLETEG